MISLPLCVVNVNLKNAYNCSQFLYQLAENTLLNYEVKSSWSFSLAYGLNIFNISTLTMSEIGNMLMYSFNASDSQSGRIALDTTPLQNFPDFNMSANSDTFLGRLNATSNDYRFAVLLELEPAQKYFRKSVRKMYAYPGTYNTQAWLESWQQPFPIPVTVVDGNTNSENFI